MIRVLTTERFLDGAAYLPKQQQQKLANLLITLEENPFHPKLRTKLLRGTLTGLYAFRITRDWRVIFQFQDTHTILLLRTANRKDIYR
ncbi:MAG: hypothetical protein G01um101429_91 [Parcubacteria group bacterium Gr01-1014_29]|nr:MAG: hypothetical protein G01um101429_91 [Parcubacteria group bacterium Gr01-1014_29]